MIEPDHIAAHRHSMPIVAMLNQPWLRFGLLAPGLLLLSGCVSKSVSDSEATFRYSLWLPISILVAGVVFVPIGLAVRQIKAALGWILMIAGPIVALAFAPSLVLERVVVNDQGFAVHSGIWGMTANLEVAFDSVKSCRIAQEQTTGKRSSRLIDVLFFHRGAAPPARFPLNNDVKIEAGKEIVARLSRQRIPVTGLR